MNIISEHDMYVDTCWVKGCGEPITLRALNTSTYCIKHEREMLDAQFGPPPKEVLLWSS